MFEHENKFNDELLEHFLNKNIPDFWKCWANKTHNNVVKDVYVNGSNSESHVATSFADHFEAVYHDCSAGDNAKLEFDKLIAASAQTMGAPSITSHFSVELIDKCIRKLKLGRASGPDELCAEHLLYAHPVVSVHLSMLFRDMAIHYFVPDEFGKGIIIPLLKDKLGNANDLNNYRGITLVPIISKLFELVMLEICAPYLITDDLQFGFKSGLGCNNAIFVLHKTVEHFLSKGSSIFAASLDIRKAFDRVNHYKLFSAIINRGVPKWIVLMFVNWYSKLRVAVRWKSSLSRVFNVPSGVRQGGVSSPAFFNVFIDAFLCCLRNCNAGCKINGCFVGAIMYADDLIILSASVSGLQTMLNSCSDMSDELILDFNCNKCNCICIGPAHKYRISDMYLGREKISWSNHFKYLGVNYLAGRKLTIDIDTVKRKFYVSCNSILGNTTSINEIIKLRLLESYCLPILTYATAAMNLTKTQVRELHMCWNSVYRRVFGYNRWESVRCLIYSTGRIDFTHLRNYLRLKFYSASLACSNKTYASIMRLHCLSQEFTSQCTDAGLGALTASDFASMPIWHLRRAVDRQFAIHASY